MAAPSDLVVLLRTLDPTPEVTSTLELLDWVQATRPEISVRVVSIAGGAEEDHAQRSAQVTRLDGTTEAVVSQVMRRARLSRPAEAARSGGLRRLLRTDAVPILVTASAGRLLRWLDPAAGPVVGRVHGDGPTLDQLEEQDRNALVARVERWIEGPDLFPQTGERDDRPDFGARHRAALELRHHLPPGCPLVMFVGGPEEVIPADPAIGAMWDLISARPGLHALWALPTGAGGARVHVERHLADAGLGGIVAVHDGGPFSWAAMAAVDVVAAPLCHEQGSPAAMAAIVASGRTVTWPEQGVPGPTTVAAIAELLPGGPAWTAPDHRWHAPVGGPAILDLLGLS